MPLRYLIDENLRGILFRAIGRHNVRAAWFPLDVVRVGDPPDLPLSADNPAVLKWAERERRILISHDKETLPKHLTEFLSHGGRCPGIFLPRAAPLAEIVEFLVCAAYASEGEEWDNQITFIP